MPDDDKARVQPPYKKELVKKIPPISGVWNPQEHTYGARFDLARKVFWLTALIACTICFLAMAPLMWPFAWNTAAALEAAKFLSSSIFPAIIGVLGSVIGFYFGNLEQKEDGAKAGDEFSDPDPSKQGDDQKHESQKEHVV